jgi:nucleotide-binding universal stress UspA family protein
MKKILVPVDGSDNGKKALMKAKSIGTAFNSEITIVYIMDDVSGISSFNITDYQTYKEPLTDAFRQHARKILDDAMENFKDYNNKVDTLIEQGNPAYKLLEISEEGDYDLIVIGSRGLGPFSRAVMGSVSNKVVHHAKMSVLVVK